MDKRKIKVGSFYRPEFAGIVSEVIGIEKTKKTGGEYVVHRLIFDGVPRQDTSRTPLASYAGWVVAELHGYRVGGEVG